MVSLSVLSVESGFSQTDAFSIVPVLKFWRNKEQNIVAAKISDF